MKSTLNGIIKESVLTIVLIMTVLAVFIIRSASDIFFKPDAYKNAIKTIKGSDFILSEKVASLPGNKLIVLLDGNGVIEMSSATIISSSSDSILEKKFFDLIAKNKGPILLSSTDQSVSARVWMILAQKGIDNLYILASSDDEVSKNKFRVDTVLNRY
ncbi:MAG TPA: hypothetical protein VHO50_08410 [Bacteroidales bacterium]|nr:hypothetical protein [Bacteroidales bacterium]